MKPHNYLFCFLMVVQCLLRAQSQRQETIDSLLLKLPAAQQDTSKVNLLNALAFNYPYFDPDAGLRYGFEALDLARKLKWTKGIAESYSMIGANYANKAEYAKALDYEYRALKLFEQLHDTASQAVLLQSLGVVYHTSKNQDKALEYDQKALGLFIELNDKEGQAAIYSNMANVYYTLRQPDKVLEFDLKSLHIYEELEHQPGVARLLGNIANLFAEEGEFSKAMPYYFNALRKETALNNKNGITRNMGNIGETYLDIAKDASGSITPDSLIPAGRPANLKKAVEYLSKAIEFAKELKQTEYILAFEEVLSEAYLMSGRTLDAFNTYREYIAVRDSVYDVEKYNEATRRELDYEYGKREDSIQYAKRLTEVRLESEKKSRRKETILYSAGLLLVVIFSIFMVNRWLITKRQKKVIDDERKRSEELLLNILPSEVAEELKVKGKSDARLFDEVTVMFTDFKDFTQISEQLQPSELVSEIDTYFKVYDEIIGKYQIEKIKTIGDSYMCAAGLPVPGLATAADVVSAAMEIQEYMKSVATAMNNGGRHLLELRIGIHTGPVVAGIVGLKKFAYDIWGDTVNIASRMESSSEAGKINISGSTFERVKDKFKCTYRGRVEAKHKGEIDMYFVDGKLNSISENENS